MNGSWSSLFRSELLKGNICYRWSSVIVHNPSSEWLHAEGWRFVQEAVPITCVDVLPMSSRQGTPPQIGLILRDTPQQGRRWCLIGGRLLRNEPLKDAIKRQFLETLGNEVKFELVADPQPLYVAQYFTFPRPDTGWDTRQHAVGLIFSVEVSGNHYASGEAHDFAFFSADSLPSPREIGFNQHPILLECLRRLQFRDANR